MGIGPFLSPRSLSFSLSLSLSELDLTTRALSFPLPLLNSQQPLEFPWVNSYYRMMIHRSAIYFQLSRKVDPLNKQITLSKNSCSAM